MMCIITGIKIEDVLCLLIILLFLHHASRYIRLHMYTDVNKSLAVFTITVISFEVW